MPLLNPYFEYFVVTTKDFPFSFIAGEKRLCF